MIDGSDYTAGSRPHVTKHGGLVVLERTAASVVHDLPHRGNQEGGWTYSQDNEKVCPLD